MQRISSRREWAWASLIILTMMLGLPWPALAQFRFPLGSKRDASSGEQSYNPQTVTTVKGQVESLGGYGMTGWRVTPGMQTQGLVLKTDKDQINVDLGPPWYVSKQGFHLNQGDSLEVTGSRVTSDGQTRLLATTVKKDGQTLKVRDEQGMPLWREQDRGGRGSRGMGSGGRGSGGHGQFNW